MSERQDFKDLGPLPIADRNAELQRRSIASFQSSLPSDKFVFRSETIEDAGVDGSLELLADGCYTNLRSQVQLKSTDSNETNADGSVSVQIRVSNLNYLLNGPCPIYVLYVFPRGELRFAWARDERKRLDETTPDWLQQEQITIRFRSMLTSETLEEIYQRICQEAQFQRRINNTLDVASSAEPIVVRIDPETLGITDPEEAKKILLNSGTAIISAGYVDEIKNLIRILNPSDAQLPRVLLVNAHAEYNQGRYKTADALLSEASLRLEELSADDQLFLETLQDGCQYQTGQISISEFSQRLTERIKGDNSNFSLSNRLEQLRYTLFLERDLPRRTTLLEELKVLVNEIISAPDKADALKIHARICWAEAEGYQITLNFLQITAEMRVRFASGSVNWQEVFQAEETMNTLLAKFKAWDKSIIEVIQDAANAGNPYLVANALVIRGNIYFLSLTTQKMSSFLYSIPFILSKPLVNDFIKTSEQASQIFKQAKNLEAELRANILMADFYELIGNQIEAKKIAMGILPKAKVMGYASLILRAEEHLSGQSPQSKVEEAFRPRTEIEKAGYLAQMSDEELRQNADQMLKILGLPEARLPIMEREYFYRRDIAREKLGCCRHIELLEDKQHQASPTTHYRTDPLRFCRCRFHGYFTNIGYPDGRRVIAAFKKSYCEECIDKNPLNEASE